MSNGISELLKSYGTSLGETRKLMPLLTEEMTKQKEARLALPQVPEFFTPAEVGGLGLTTETGEPFKLDEGWLLKMTPGANGAEPVMSFITPEKWEITQDQTYISPEGQRFTQEEIQTQIETPEIPLQVEDVFGKVFPTGYSGKDIEQTLTWLRGTGGWYGERDWVAEARQQEFAQAIWAIGRTEDTESLLSGLGMKPEEITQFFAPAPTTVPEESKAKDIWDTARVAFTNIAYQTKQFFVGTLPNLLFRDIKPGDPVWDQRTGRNIPCPPEQVAAYNEKSKTSRDQYRQTYTKNEQQHQDWLSKHPELETRPEWQGNIIDTIKNHPEVARDWGYWANQLAAGAPGTLAILAGMVLSAVTENPLPLIASITALTPAQIEEDKDLMLAHGATEDQAAKLGTAVGIASNALLFIPVGKVLNGLKPEAMTLFKRTATEEIANLTAKSVLKQGLKQFGETEALFTVFGVAQQAIQNAAIKLLDTKQDLFAGIGNAAISSMVQGLPLAVFGAAGKMINVSKENAALVPDAQKKAEGWIQDPQTKDWLKPIREFITEERGGIELPPKAMADFNKFIEWARKEGIPVRDLTVTPKIEETLRAVEEASGGVREAYEAQAKIEGLKEWLSTEPATKLVNLIKKTGWYKGEVGNLSKEQYQNITGKEPSASILGKETQVITEKAHTTKAGEFVPEKTYKTTKEVVRWEYALDDVATEMGYESGDALKVAIEGVGKAQTTIKELQTEIATIETKTPLPALPEPISEKVAVIPTGGKALTPAQVSRTLELFGKYIEDSSTLNAWELTRQLRTETRSGRAELLKVRVQELIVQEGISAEDAMKRAISETLSGKLPVVKTDYVSDLTDRMRDVLFNKVYQVLRDEPFEMASTVTALTNALTGKAIPREPGVKGGSAYTRLERVFGDQPEVLKSIDKMASEQKPLEKVAEDLFTEVIVAGEESIPVDRGTAEYLNKLKDIPNGYKTFFEPDFEMPRASDLRTPAEVEYAQAKLKLAIDFSEGKITKDAYDIAVLEAREKAYPTPPVTKYEAPIEDAIKQIPLWPTPARDAVIRVLKEMAWSPVDIGGFIKANKSSFDMSYPRQVAPFIPGHPTEFVLSMVDAFKATFSQKSTEASWVRITHDPLYAIYDALQSKLGRDFLRPPDMPKGTKQYKGVEEFGYLFPDRLIPKLTAKIPWVKLSNRGFVTGCNSDLWRIFENTYKGALREGEKYASGELKLERGKAFDIMKIMDAEATRLADWSGRASLGPLQKAAPILGNILYAPRFAWGRAIGWRQLFSSNSYVRKQAWRDATILVGTVGGALVLGNQLGWWDLETDRNSADFGKARIGNLRIDPWGGAQQFFVFFSRVFDLVTAPITGKTAMGKSTTTGAEYPLNILNVGENFLKSKEAPMVGLLLEYVTGKTYSGEEVDVKNLQQWADRISPMALMDAYEAFAEKPSSAIPAGILSFFGLGVQTYTGDWKENIPKLGLPKYSDNLYYGMTKPVYDWADFYSDTASQFKGVDPATLTEAKGYPPKVRLIVETARSLEESNIIPNVKLISMNADPDKGKTYVDNYKIWQERQKIIASGDEKALKAFDADERNNQAYLGNISQRQFALLSEYWAITDKTKQAEFLETHPELSQNSREEWLKSHPEENAKQALAGKAKLMTQKAYDIAQKLIKDYDIPDSAVTSYLPPQDVAKAYFERIEIVDKWGANSWEDKLLRAKNPNLVKWLNESGNPLDEVDTPIASLELKTNPKFREIYDKIESFSDEDSPDFKDDKIKDKNGLTERDRAVAELKATMIEDDLTYRDTERKIEAIEKGTNENPVDDKLVNAHIEFMRIQDKEGIGSTSAEVMLYRVDNPEYNAWRMDKNIWGDNALKPVDETRIPIWRIDVKWQEQDKQYDAIEGETSEGKQQRQAFLKSNPEYADDRLRRDAYGKDFPTPLIETYVEYYKIPDKSTDDWYKEHPSESYYEDDWFLMEHPDFYKAMFKLGIWTEPRDFTKVPSREVYRLYRTYLGLPKGQAKLDFRVQHPELDGWLLLTKKVTKAATDRGKKEAKKTEWEKLEEKRRFEEWLKGLMPK